MAYPYTIVHSDRRTLALEITREARLVVRAPRACPDSYIARFVEKQDNWIEAHMEKQRQRAQNYPELTEAQRLELKKRAKALLPPLVARYAAVMGLEPAGITISSAQKRFGSCTAKNRLCFSYRLMRYPEEAIEYVVVHELAHLVHRNHGKDFYALVASVMPDYKKRDALLKQ